MGCGLCVSLAPNLMGLDAPGQGVHAHAHGGLVAGRRRLRDGTVPTNAIIARKIERIVPLKAGERGAERQRSLSRAVHGPRADLEHVGDARPSQM